MIPGTLYRLRSYSLVSLKELLYGEMYFSSLKELTDPYDTKVYYRFNGDNDLYCRLLSYLTSPFLPKGSKLDYAAMAGCLAESDLSYEELIEKVRSARFQELLLREVLKTHFPDKSALHQSIVQGICHEIHKHIGKNAYIVSFTGEISNPLIWSVHSENHTGFALAIQPFNGRLFQNPLRRTVKAQLEDGTLQYSNSTDHDFHKVNYVDDIQPLNAFYSFPKPVYGQSVSSEEIAEYWSLYETLATTKYEKWEFENEFRLVDVSDWMPSYIDQNGPITRYSVDRLFYYDQTQLKGIVCGMNMSESARSELIRTAIVMRDRLLYECKGCLPIFYFYEAKQSHSEYNIISDQPFLGLDYANRQFIPEAGQAKENELKGILSMWKKSTTFDRTEHVLYKT